MPDTQKAMDKLVSDMDSHLLLTHKEDHLKATDNNPPFLSSGNGLNPHHHHHESPPPPGCSGELRGSRAQTTPAVGEHGSPSHPAITPTSGDGLLSRVLGRRSRVSRPDTLTPRARAPRAPASARRRPPRGGRGSRSPPDSFWRPSTGGRTSSSSSHSRSCERAHLSIARGPAAEAPLPAEARPRTKMATELHHVGGGRPARRWRRAALLSRPQILTRGSRCPRLRL